MSFKQLNTAILNQYVNRVFSVPLFTMHSSYINALNEKVIELYEKGVGVGMVHGRLWGDYNAVTEYVDQYCLELKSDSMRLKSMRYGSGES